MDQKDKTCKKGTARVFGRLLAIGLRSSLRAHAGPNLSFLYASHSHSLHPLKMKKIQLAKRHIHAVFDCHYRLKEKTKRKSQCYPVLKTQQLKTNNKANCWQCLLKEHSSLGNSKKMEIEQSHPEPRSSSSRDKKPSNALFVQAAVVSMQTPTHNA